MSQQKEETKPSSAVELPVKRKRGRPRKEGTLIQEENVTPIPKSAGTKQPQDGGVDPEGDTEDVIVGQPVSGVINGTFDAGYFLTVKVGDTNTVMTGVVFQEGRIAPVTAANDVAPNVKMFKRQAFPFPGSNAQTHRNSSVEVEENDSKQSSKAEKEAHTVPDEVLSSELDSNIAPAIENQSSPVKGSLSNDTPKSDTLNQTSDCGQENQDAPLPDFGAKTWSEGSIIEVKDFNDLIAGPSCGGCVSMLPGNEVINEASHVHDQPKNHVSNLNELFSSDPPPEVEECHSVPPETNNMQIDVPMEQNSSPKNNAQHDVDAELTLKISCGDDTSQQIIEKPTRDAAYINEESISQSVMNVQGTTISDKVKFADEQCDLPRVTGPANDMDCDNEDVKFKES